MVNKYLVGSTATAERFSRRESRVKKLFGQPERGELWNEKK